VLGIASPRDGWVVDLDPLRLGRCAMTLGAGRRQPTDTIDLHAGILLLKQRGDPVARDEPLALVHGRSQPEVDLALREVLASYRFGDEPPPARVLVLERV
jgi:thymidine phosphorylase